MAFMNGFNNYQTGTLYEGAPKGAGRTCRHYLRGHCQLGEACSFLHDKQDPTVAASEKTQYAGTVPCRHFLRGFCQLGETCTFSHDKEMCDQAKQDGTAENLMKYQVCLHWNAGHCAQGNSCTHKHPGSSAGVQAWNGDFGGGGQMGGGGGHKPCRHFARGFCQLGNSCNFSHSTAPAAPTNPHLGMMNGGGLLNGGGMLGAQGQYGGAQHMGAPQHGVPSWVAAPAPLPPQIPSQNIYTGTPHMPVIPQMPSQIPGLGNSFNNNWQNTMNPMGNGIPMPTPTNGFTNNFAPPSTTPGQPDGRCRHFARGFCQMGRQCGFPHIKTKFKLCQNFEVSGMCQSGASCTFAHGQHELYILPPSALPSVKSKLCIHFQKVGTCAMGERCNFAHGEDQLNTPVTSASATAPSTPPAPPPGIHTPVEPSYSSAPVAPVVESWVNSGPVQTISQKRPAEPSWDSGAAKIQKIDGNSEFFDTGHGSNV